MIEESLRVAFDPTHLLVDNESHKHSVKPGSETHFAVVVVSPAFDGLNLVARHRRVNETLKAVFSDGLHALRIHAVTPAEFEARPDVPAAPPCLGGSKRAQKNAGS
jgi:BolA protein